MKESAHERALTREINRLKRKVSALERKMSGMVPDDNMYTMPMEELRKLQYMDDYPGVRAEATRIFTKRHYEALGVKV